MMEDADSTPIKGVITAIHGDIVEVGFQDRLPGINDALFIEMPDGMALTLEVHQHTSNTSVKAIALGFTQGLKRGMPVVHSGGPLRIPAGKECVGRVFNAFGEPIDDGPPLTNFILSPAHRPPPLLKEQIAVSGILETGIKIIDLLSPFPKGGR